jgi:hypothetical protein
VDRAEAVNLIREIDRECKDIRGTSIMLMEPDPNDALAKGYRVQIRMKATPMRLRCLKTVAGQYDLQVNVAADNWLVTIYTPKKAIEQTSGQGLM